MFRRALAAGLTVGMGLFALTCRPPRPRGTRTELPPEAPSSEAPSEAPAASATPTPYVAKSPDVATREAWVEASRDARCERAVRCGTIGSSQRDECLRGPASGLLQVWGYPDHLGIEDAIVAGRFGVDLSRTGPCLDHLLRGACHTPWWTIPPGCRGGARHPYAVPAAAPGEMCTRNRECVDGFCDNRVGCEGECHARSDVGEPCGPHQVCLDTLFCDGDTCTKRGDEGASCRGDRTCREGLFCDGYVRANRSEHYHSVEQPGTCARPRGKGESCADSAREHPCEGGLFCDFGADPPVCRPRLPAGVWCRWDDACVDGTTCRGLKLTSHRGRYAGMRSVKSPGRCQPHLDEGDPCDPDAWVSGCPRSMTCDESTQRCRLAGHEGDPCRSRYCHRGETCTPTCLGPFYCHPTKRVCTAVATAGEACVPSPKGEDDPCWIGRCDPAQRRCARRCTKQ